METTTLRATTKNKKQQQKLGLKRTNETAATKGVSYKASIAAVSCCRFLAEVFTINALVDALSAIEDKMLLELYIFTVAAIALLCSFTFCCCCDYKYILYHCFHCCCFYCSLLQPLLFLLLMLFLLLLLLFYHYCPWCCLSVIFFQLQVSLQLLHLWPRVSV